MFKFQFVRMEEPSKPTWNCESIEWPIKQIEKFKGADMLTFPVWVDIWNWLRGAKNTDKPTITPSEPIDGLKFLLASSAEDEAKRLHAAYNLGALGADPLKVLLEAFNSGNEAAMRNAGFGLVVLGAVAVPELMKLLENSKNDFAQQFAAFFLGELGLHAIPARTVLIHAMRHSGNYTRRCCAEALGKIPASEKSINALMISANDPDEMIRQFAVLAIARHAAHATSAISTLNNLLIIEQNRYVVAYALYALKCMNNPEADKILIEHLWTSRYCPFTNNYSTF